MKDKDNNNNKRRKQKYSALQQALEPRMVYDASVAADAKDVDLTTPVDTARQTEPTAVSTPQQEAAKTLDSSSRDISGKITQESSDAQSNTEMLAEFSSFNTPSKELVFIDSKVANPQLMLQGISSNAEIHIINADQNGMSEIKSALEAKNGEVGSIYILSNDAAGVAKLGTSVLNDNSLDASYKSALADWGSHMSTDAVISVFASSTSTDGHNELSKLLFNDFSDTAISAPLRNEVVFIDTSVEGYMELVTGVNANAKVVILDSHKDGLTQIQDYLKDKSNIDAIHLVSHGSEASLNLGTSNLNVFSMANPSSHQRSMLLYPNLMWLTQYEKSFVHEQ